MYDAMDRSAVKALKRRGKKNTEIAADMGMDPNGPLHPLIGLHSLGDGLREVPRPVPSSGAKARRNRGQLGSKEAYPQLEQVLCNNVVSVDDGPGVLPR